MRSPAVFLISTSILLAGCSGLQTQLDYDKNAEKIVSVLVEGKKFDVRDNLTRSSALVTEGASADILKSIAEGLTMTLVDLTASVSKFEAAMENYLKENKQSECAIVRSNFISDNLGGGIGYEIFYKCE